ncbi:MAG TPA: TrbG/VirB9 family P-type conjugative transfer protein [Sphingomicrobium sp.]|jgi:type IV secretion system protein VirB9|nr:TrbG/VirB9 family P-type conjugative transfer protein [Sphingomicrobium sp.]
MRAAAIVAFAFAFAAPVSGQVRPMPGQGNPHLQTVSYDPDQIVVLEAAAGYQLTVALSPDEQIQNVAIGDGSAWQVNVNHAGDHLFIKANAPVPTNMTVITSVRVYNFDLDPVPSPMPDTPYNVQFTYPELAARASGAEYVDVSPLRRARSRYKVSGDRMLRPDSVSNDGEHTYISWSRDKPIPAVYAIGATGEEMLANGGMRDDTYVVDGVPARLVFRIDEHEARAVRLAPKKAR